jgi:protein-L-isoaspartate(D-aspartate) O-methyltransferase
MEDPTEAARLRMVEDQLVARMITDPAVLAAMRSVPRHRFVPPAQAHLAYADHPLPIGHGVTISQPYIVALMTELAQIEPGARVLEIGTGCGYQTAILAAIGADVYSVEIIPALAAEAAATLAALGHSDLHLRVGDGHAGWPEHAPFAAILVAAAAPRVPQPLIDQLGPGGRLVIPVGRGVQDLQLIERDGDGVAARSVLSVQFVPMTGVAQRNP